MKETVSATKTEAFVLKTMDYRDTSLCVRFYTRDAGKLSGIIRGIRDARARYGSTLEPFSLNEILFYRRRRGGDLHQVTQVETLDLFTPVREDLERLSYASYFVELIDELVEPEEPNRAIFDLLRDSLAFLTSGASPRRAARIFEVKFFSLLGFMPEIKACVSCRTERPDRAFFNVSLGGIVCSMCAAKNEVRGIPVSKGTLHFLERVARSGVGELQNVKVSQEVGEELESILRRFVDYQLPNKLKSVIFLEKMELV